MRSTRVRRAAAIVSPVFLLALGAAATTAQAQARPLSSSVTDKVIVVLKNQVTGTPDTPANAANRAGMVKSLQRGVMSELTATRAKNVRSISLVNAVAATVSPEAARDLAANPAVAEVIPDLPIPVATPTAVQPGKAAAGLKPLPGACAPKGKVELDPQAIENIHAAGGAQTAQGLGYTGAGVKVAWIADGIDINNPDFIRANGKHVFVDYQDFSGTGTNAPTGGAEAFLDASSIAAQGRHVYNVASYGVGPVRAVRHPRTRRGARRQPGRAERVRFRQPGLQLRGPRGHRLRRHP